VHDHEHDAGAGAAHDAGVTAVVDAGAPGGSDAGTSFDLQVAFGAAISRANNELQVELSQANGAALVGASVSVALFMPEHGHGQPAPTVTEASAGHFHAMISFIMPGTWEVTVTATHASTTQTQKLTVLVP
jgi:nitrogen fixation protein FixH